MATSPKAFLVELYREYLDTASFLRDQTRSLRVDPEVSWRDLESFEERLEACLDGLVVGGDLAAQVARIRAKEGDPGELYAAVCLFCRQGMRSVVMELAKELGPDAPPRIDAVADALKQEGPEAWFEELISLASKEPRNDALLLLASKVTGYRRWKPAGPMLGKLLAGASTLATSELVWALERVGAPDLRSMVLGKLHDPDEQVRVNATHALLCRGDSSVPDLCLKAAPAQRWAAIFSGLVGSRAAKTPLLACARVSSAQPEAILALGLLGDVSAVPDLIGLLAKSVHPTESAQALELMTGASLYETVFVPETEEATAEGAVPVPVMKPDGKPYGSSVKRLTLNPKAWQRWWSENEPKFSSQLRYRKGQPCSPEVVLATIESLNSPARIRHWAAEELRFRYGFDWHFELDWRVRDQLAAIETARHWVGQNGARFAPGAWYFCGQKS
jgi:uncharacterized protein (TIGR02270 family)